MCAGLFVAAGFCAHGLAGAGGIGKVMAEWIVAGEPSLDVWEMDIRRFGPQYRSPATPWRARRRSTRPTTTSATPATSARRAGRCEPPAPTPGTRDHGAAFGEKSGWERVNWYERNAAAGDESLRPRGWAGMHWSPAIGAEALAARETAALFDESSFAKLEVVGSGRGQAPGAAVRQPGGPRGRADHLHPDAQPPRRDRVRLHRHPGGGGDLPDRHRDSVRQPRCQLDSPPSAPRRLGARQRCDLALGLLRPVGPGRARSWSR